MGKEEEMTSEMVPLCMVNPDLYVTNNSPTNRHLSVMTSSDNCHVSVSSSSDNQQVSVLSSNSAAPFAVPKGWTVKLVPRADGSRTDKYYYEPNTKRMFRSIKEIERYLNGEEYTPRHKSSKLGSQPRLTTRNLGSDKRIISGGRQLLTLKKNDFKKCQLAVVSPTTTAATSAFILPEGWVVEKVLRKNQGRDKYYYEPGTGRKFRSLTAVERHIQEEKRASALLSDVSAKGNSGKRKRTGDSASGVVEPPDKIRWVLNDPGGLAWDPRMAKTFVEPHKRKKAGASASGFVEPPDKIRWVLNDLGGVAWLPLMGKKLVPDPIKNHWAFGFMQLMSNKNGAAPHQDLKGLCG